MLNVAVLDNPSPFCNPFQFEITFECMEDLPEGKHYIPIKYLRERERRQRKVKKKKKDREKRNIKTEKNKERER